MVVLTLRAGFSVRRWSLLRCVPGRMAPVGPGRTSRRRAVRRLPMGPRSESRGRSRKQRFGPGLPIGGTTWRRPVPEASAPVGEVGWRSEDWALVLLGRPPSRRPDCPPGPLFLRLLGRPMDYMLFSWAEPWCGSQSPRNPGFMDPTSR